MASPHLVAALDEIPEGEAKVIPAATLGTPDDVAVFHSDGEYFAINDTCTHEDASLSEGWIEGDEVE